MAAPADKWLRGTIKEVPAGDTLVIAGPSRGGPPPEKRLTLSSLVAPRLGRRDGSKPEEPFAWQSKEFLRQLSIGQECIFKTDYTLDNVPGREFGSVFISNAKENLALTVAAKGWAKVRSGGGSQSPYYNQLVSASQNAETNGYGLFNKDDNGVRKSLPSSQDFDSQALLDSVGKGKPLRAIVEQVPTGSVMRVTLLPDFQYVSVLLCGVQAPSMGRRPPPQPAAASDSTPAASSGQTPAEGSAQKADGGSTTAAKAAEPSAASVAASTPESAPEPHAREAKYFSETRALNREVRVVLEGVDKFGNLFGSVLYPEGHEAVDLGLQLAQNGLAKVVEWGANMLPSGAGHKLREAERAAKQAKKGMWHSWTPPATNSAKLADVFTGVVCEVVGGDMLSIADNASSGVERRVALSSVRAPRLGRRDERPEPWAAEAKEFLRSTLIGKQVNVSLEYMRKIPAPAGGTGPQNATGERPLSFGTITIATPGAQTPSNVAELLLARGLVTIVRHRIDDDRSAHYEALMEAEQVGKKGKKGLHSGKDAPLHHINDVSVPGSAARAKQYLPFLSRGKTAGIVEHVVNGHRLRISIPKEGTVIAFSPSGVRAPSMQPPPGSKNPGVGAEPFGEESQAFTRTHCLQREVEIEVDSVDRGGTFLGSLVVPGAPDGPFALGPALLRAGLAKLHHLFDQGRISGGRLLVDAEAEARDAKRKVWEGHEPAANGGAHDSSASQEAVEPESLSVTVTEVVDANQFFVQVADEKRVSWLAEQLSSLGLDEAPKAPKLRVGQLCAARFSHDKQWYRAKVLHARTGDPTKPSYDVSFIDFGNRQTVGQEEVRELNDSITAVPAQAFPASLACIQVKGTDDDHGGQAAQSLYEQVGGGVTLKALVTRRDKSATPHHLHLLITVPGPDGSEETINAQLLADGFARLQLPPASQVKLPYEVIKALTDAEQSARKDHRGMWEYGDVVGDDDDEEDVPKPKAWGRR